MVDVVLPVLDEERSIPWVLDRLPEEFSAIVVDNGSQDHSAEIARSLGARVVEEPARGFGSACFAGLAHASSDVVCFMDCDRSLDPVHLPRLVKPLLDDEADIVLGARRSADGALSLHARVGNRVLTRRVRRKTGVVLEDLGPMRAARRKPLLSLDLSDRRFGWPLEMVLKAAEARWRIKEIPVPYLPRIGSSKVTGTLGGTIKAIYDMGTVLR
jgi:glycosyltransferase involved in cell wall biosynthesis